MSASAAGLRVLVCVKRVPESSGELTLTEDAQGVDGRYVGFTLSPHDMCAVELAVQLSENAGGIATVLTLGPSESREQLLGALALGCREAVLIEAESGRFGPSDVAREIAAVIRDHEADNRGYDVVLLGNDASDTGDFQVGVRLAYALGLPVVTGIAKVEVADRVLSAHAQMLDGDETYAVPLPAVATVLEGGVEPRYPSVRGRMGAKKVAIEERTPTGEPRGSGRVRMLLPPPTPSSVEVLGEGPDAAAAVVDLLEKLGVGR